MTFPLTSWFSSAPLSTLPLVENELIYLEDVSDLSLNFFCFFLLIATSTASNTKQQFTIHVLLSCNTYLIRDPTKNPH